jgi:hypothetical protein
MSEKNAEIYSKINGRCPGRPGHGDKNQFRFIVAATVLEVFAADSAVAAGAESLRLAFSKAEEIVAPLLEEEFYRFEIDRSYREKDFNELGQLRRYFIFVALLTSSYLYETSSSRGRSKTI